MPLNVFTDYHYVQGLDSGGNNAPVDRNMPWRIQPLIRCQLTDLMIIYIIWDGRYIIWDGDRLSILTL